MLYCMIAESRLKIKDRKPLKIERPGRPGLSVPKKLLWTYLAGWARRATRLARRFFCFLLILAGVVGSVPAGPLEMKGGLGDELFNRPLALGALGNRFIRELLYLLELVSALFALIFVYRHQVHPQQIYYIYILGLYGRIVNLFVMDGASGAFAIAGLV